jgi:cytochrome bd-type quinol oxidase subunit 2
MSETKAAPETSGYPTPSGLLTLVTLALSWATLGLMYVANKTVADTPDAPQLLTYFFYTLYGGVTLLALCSAYISSRDYTVYGFGLSLWSLAASFVSLVVLGTLALSHFHIGSNNSNIPTVIILLVVLLTLGRR